MIQTNPNVNIKVTEYGHYQFTPDNGYAMWMDDEEGNMHPETGEPLCYWLTIRVPNEEQAIERAPHIWAKPIDETMEVFGKGSGTETQSVDQPAKARAMSLAADTAETDNNTSHTYVDENGVVRQKRPVL